MNSSGVNKMQFFLLGKNFVYTVWCVRMDLPKILDSEILPKGSIKAVRIHFFDIDRIQHLHSLVEGWWNQFSPRASDEWKCYVSLKDVRRTDGRMLVRNCANHKEFFEDIVNAHSWNVTVQSDSCAHMSVGWIIILFGNLIFGATKDRTTKCESVMCDPGCHSNYLIHEIINLQVSIDI